MNPNEKIEQQYISSNNPQEQREIITKKVEAGPREVGLSPATMIVIALLAVLAIGTVVYVVNNRNANEAANRQAALEASRAQAEAQTRNAQANSSQPPVIIEQPAPTQQAPVIIQQAPASSASSEPKNVMDDSTMMELASKRLADESELAGVTVTVLDAKASLMGTVASKELKNKAEKIVKNVRGIKSVDNQLIVSEQ